ANSSAMTHIRDNDTSIPPSIRLKRRDFLRYAWLLKGQATVLWSKMLSHWKTSTPYWQTLIRYMIKSAMKKENP
ncbi:MAG: hypothetical protein PHX08_25415, partial [Lachnospiraceae bacterium]|nr:hypothetical protein [Lachnospiraceae bacterium]